MNRQPSNRPTWVMHFVLALATCVWLSAARELRVSFILTVFVTFAITLCGGFITAIRAKGVFRRGQSLALHLRGQLRLRDAESERLLIALPALFATWCILYPKRRVESGAKQMHEFALWVRWAFATPSVNIADWMMERIDSDGRMAQLRGVYEHLTAHERPDAAELVYIHGHRLLGEMLVITSVETPGAKTTPPDEPQQTTSPSWAQAA